MNDNKKICIECNQEKSMGGGFSVLDIGSKGDDIEFDDVCRDCRRIERDASKAQRSSKNMDEIDSGENDDDGIQNVACQFASLVCGDIRVLESFNPIKLFESIPESADYDYDAVLTMAREIIFEGRGMAYPNIISVKHGNYVVIGHACGCHAEPGIIRCVNTMCKYLNAVPIHVGPIFDSHGLYSSDLFKLDGLIVVADRSEVFQVSKLQEKYGFLMARYGVEIAGTTIVRNQYYRENPFTISSSQGIQVKDEYDNIVMPRTLLEVHARTRHGRTQLIATTGCICVRHQQRKPPKKPKASSVADAVGKFSDGTRSGRRQSEIAENWKNGMIVVQSEDGGRSVCLACEVKMDRMGKYHTGYYGDVISENTVTRAPMVGLVVGDVHVPLHDPQALSVVDNVAKRLRADYFVNLGDHVNNSGLNHHKMDRGQPIVDIDVASEYGKASSVLETMIPWAPKRYIIFGNHERFRIDFVGKFPQLGGILDMRSLLRLEELGYEAHDEKSVLKIGNATFIHGEMRKYGSRGDRNKKNTDVFGENVISGHCHNPSTRLGSHFVGLLGKLDQEYNEPEASNWIHGFAVVSHYDDMVFFTIMSIVDYVAFMGEEVIHADADCSKWEPGDFVVKYTYEEK